MRKTRARINHRKPAKGFPFRRRKPTADETDWILLDAHVSPTRKRAVRRKRANWMVRGLAIVCLCATAPLGAKFAYESIFFENEEFVLNRLNVQTDGVLRQHHVLEVSNVAVGMRLMDLDLRGIRERIEKLPVVDEVVVSREMPDKLNILVRERTPVAWVSCPPLGVRPGNTERGFLVDEDGILFRCLDLTDSVSSLPVIETFTMADPVEGEKLKTKGLGPALRLIAEAARSDDSLTESIHLVRLRNEWSLQAHYRSGLRAVFGAFDIERGLADLEVIVDQVAEAGATLATVDLVASENIPVTFVAPIDTERLSTREVSLQANAQDAGSSPFDQQEKHLRSILNGG